MKFDVVIGNPPYQKAYKNTKGSGANSIYDRFLDAAFMIAEHVSMIHPARFLFNAGSTSKEWNKKILNDEHFKIVHYEPDSAVFFPMLPTPIKGGIAISYHNSRKKFGAIEIFTKYPELNKIFKKVENYPEIISLSTICVTSYAYRFTEKSHEDYPQIVDLMSQGHSYDLTSNCFEKIGFLFSIDLPNNTGSYAKLLGRYENKRVYRYIKREYINDVINFASYKLFIPKANGSGEFGEIISEPILAEPNTGSTETFMSIGNFSNKSEAENLLKYIKSKFFRAMLGLVKVTQDISPSKFKYVPLQDFTDKSDIDWSKSVHEIDLQLYKKYGLDANEINFIETHVKPME